MHAAQQFAAVAFAHEDERGRELAPGRVGGGLSVKPDGATAKSRQFRLLSNDDGVAWLPTSPHLVDAMVARLFAGNFSFYRTFPPGARTTFKDQDLFAYHLTHTPGCAFVDLGPCAFWRAKGKRRCREGAPLMIHTTWWFKAIGVIERAVGSLAAGSCASLPPRLSSEEVEQLCTHSPADQSEICRRIAH